MNISALDENGKPVDWWFIYKVPKLTTDSKNNSTSGYEYIYFDPKVGKVVKSPFQLNIDNGALDRTLDNVFNKPSATTGWILYNDEKPAGAKGKDASSYGHTKGVIAFDTATKTAFWLLHSWPKYAQPGLKTMPTPEYGQTFMCISISIATASAIAKQMDRDQEPQVFSPRLPESLSKTDPLYILTQQLDTAQPSDSSALDYKSRGGLKFKVISKNKKWGKDFWNDLVGPTLKVNMDVETWIRGKIPAVLDSDGIHKTFDVKYIDLSGLGLNVPWAWPETHDHAKWGISVDGNWLCVGDINRMISQEKRGGGTIAFQCKELWKALSKTDLLVAPPGHSRTEARNLIKATQGKTTKAAPVKKLHLQKKLRQ